MLTILGEKYRYCDGVDRRSFLKLGALAMGGMGLSEILAREASAGIRNSEKAIIMVYLPGGPPHIDLVDLKPDAPPEIRGPYKPIDTNVPGIRIGEGLPKLAGMMDKLALIRSVVGLRDEHASNQCLGGYGIGENAVKQQPCLGSVLSRLHGATDQGMPPFVELIPKTQHGPYSNPGDPGYLGTAHASVRPTGETQNEMVLKDISLSRLGNRRRLLDGVDRYRRLVDSSPTVQGMNNAGRKAFDILTSDKLVRALDASKESEKLRERYGKGSPAAITDAGPDWNEQFLLARRLVEAGVRCVTLGFGGWDYHSFWDPKPGEQGQRLDQALSALVGDLHDRGMEKNVSVVCWGDFGRTPRMNKDGGRDHWPAVSFAFLACGGMRTGQVIGSTDRFAEYADERPIHFRDVHATLYHNLGISTTEPALVDSEGRPRYVLENHSPIEELI